MLSTNNIAIHCEELSKSYLYGSRDSYRTLRDVVSVAACWPLRKLRRSLSNGNHKILGVKASAPRSFWALKDVSFQVQKGEVIGIIGRNGAGKSTLLKILSHITLPTRGHAEIRGRVGSLLEVGVGFHPELSGRENIYLNGALLGMRRAEIVNKLDEIVQFAEVEKFIDTPVKRYSSGMYVRLAFAVAAHMETEILLVDEVLAVGDVAFQKKCLGRMGQVAKEGRTVLFVSHDMNAVEKLCDTVIFLEQAEINSFGKASETIRKYLTSSANVTAISETAPVLLDDTIELTRFEFTPNPVVSGEGVDFVVELMAREPIKLDDFCFLIYSSMGRRLAVLDLRHADRAYRLGRKVERIAGRIQSLPFVEGEYRVGLYLNWGARKGDFYDLVNLRVLSNAARHQVVPYEAAVRGDIELDYRLMT